MRLLSWALLAPICLPLAGFAQEGTYTATVPVVPVASQPVAGAEARPTHLEEVEVTGSRIRRMDYETAQPVFALDRAQIERSGVTSLGELLQRLVLSGSSANNPTATNNEMGVVSVDLRNLGPQRTLVLVDGHRWVGSMYYYSTGQVDLSTIPLAIIERVEVLKDGASAVYGSDAIAGVVNIITRKGYVGTDLRAQAGAYSDGRGLSQNYDLSWGSVLGRTAIFANLGYERRTRIANGDRELAQFYRFGAGPTRGTEFTPRGTLDFVPTQSNGSTLGQDLCPTNPDTGQQFCHMILRTGQTITGDPSENTASVADRYEPFNSTSLDPSVNDLYDPNALLDLSYPFQRYSLFGTLSHSFGDFALRTELLFSHRHLRHTNSAELEFGDQASDRFNTIYLAADNPYNPFGQDIGRDNGGAGSGVIRRELPELHHVEDSSVDSLRIGTGLDGEFGAFDRTFHWDAGLIYGDSHNRITHPGLDLDHLRLALGPVQDCNAAPECVPLNILGGPGSITQSMLDYVSYPSSYPKEQWLANAYATMSNDLLVLPAGTMKTAYGVEYRKESYADHPDALIVSCVSAACFPATHGSFAVSEAFAELDVPVLRDLVGARAVDLSLAGRYSHYDTYGSDTTYKAGLRWKPIEGLLLRATHSSAFRAPAISDLYLTPSSFFWTGLTDPCSDYAGAHGGQPASPTVQANCQAAGVPASYQQTPTFPGHDGGNRNLKAETADTTTAGFVFSPDFIRDLNVYLDWYRVSLENAITLLDPSFTLQSCYGSPGGSDTCSLISREPQSGAISDLRYQPLNVGGNHVQGIDFGADYILPWRRAGNFKLLVDASYLIENAVLIADATGQQQTTGFQGKETATNAYPRLKANAQLSWIRGGWQASWSVRYIHHMTEACDDGITPSLTSLGLCSLPNADPSLSQNRLRPVVYHDVQVSYEISQWHAGAVLGAQNLFGTRPPASYTNLTNSFDQATYDLPGGVFPYLRLKLAF